MESDSLKKLEFTEGHNEALSDLEKQEAAKKFQDICMDTLLRNADSMHVSDFQDSDFLQSKYGDSAEVQLGCFANDGSSLRIYVYEGSNHESILEVRVTEVDQEGLSRKEVSYQLSADGGEVVRHNVSDNLYEDSKMHQAIPLEAPWMTADKVKDENQEEWQADLAARGLERLGRWLNKQPVGRGEVEELGALLEASDPMPPR